MEGSVRGGAALSVLAALALALLLPVDGALAAPPVTNTNDSGTGSLRDAIAGATAGDTIDVPAGTYTLTSGQLDVTTALTIDGAGAGATIIRSAGVFRVFRVALPGASPTPDATIRDVTVTGGSEPSSTIEGGGGILNTDGGHLTVDRSVISGNSAGSSDNSTDHGGGGISNESPGGLTVTDSTVSQNSLFYEFGGGTSGGAGIHSTSGDLIITGSTISGNSMLSLSDVTDNGGGGIYARGASLSVNASTVSGNEATFPDDPGDQSNGGGGIYTSTSSNLGFVTIAGNATDSVGGGLLASSPQTTAISLSNSIVASNAPTGCAESGIASILSGGGNMENPGNSCGLGTGDFPGTDPNLGPLADNGGPTATHALPPGSPAIDNASVGSCDGLPGPDQRGAGRPAGPACDIGAYEFDGLSSLPPGCSRTGSVAVSLVPPPGNSATAAHFRVDGGAESTAPAAGSPSQATVPVPEGSHSLEFWGEFSPHGQELAHHLTTVLVDTDFPRVRITSDQGRTGYTVGDPASFSVRASDLGSGLASDPSASRLRIDTSRPRSVRINRTATDNCGNATTSEFVVTVLPKPVLGQRVNLIPLSGRVLVSLPGSAAGAGARASQKGRRFIPLQQARQVPVGSLIDTRRGRVRLVSARDARARRTQAGQFDSGMFQVLQSRNRRAKGLTSLRLKGSSFRPCRPARGRAGRAHAALSKRAIRRLRSNARGRFRTRGRYSAATVRGTVWTTTDRCDGTLTKVGRGRVAVRDFRRRKTVVLRRGKSYLAKAPAG